MARKPRSKAAPAVVIKREELVEGGHHGGAWKVAYADFVTAMMAFFLVMWLINATTEKQRRGLADYFSPIAIHTRSVSGTGRPFGGLTPYETGRMVSNRGAVSITDVTGAVPISGTSTTSIPGPQGHGRADRVEAFGDPDATPVQGAGAKTGGVTADAATRDVGAPIKADLASGTPATGRGTQADATAVDAGPGQGNAGAGNAVAGNAGAGGAAEQQQLADAAQALKAALAALPEAAELLDQVVVDVTPAGLQIQIRDSEARPMFAAGSAEPNPRARALLGQIAPILANLDEPISISGHTDGAACAGSCRSNWDLSGARAEASRVELERGGLADARIADVTGRADRDLLIPADPLAAVNRRIVIVVHRTHHGAAQP